jgi:hypothetical protein
VTAISIARTGLLACMLAGFAPSLASAQADLSIPDSIIDPDPWDHFFPIWGDRVVERGFDLPYPLGISANYLYQSFDVTIDGLELSLGDNPLQPVDIVEFENAKTSINTGNVRADLWIFPFLNVSMMYGKGKGNTGVVLSEPVSFSTNVDFNGTYYGFGVLGAFGFDGYFFTLDWNQTWFTSDILESSVLADLVTVRAGKTFEVGGRNLSLWLGTMYQSYENETVGAVTFDDIFGGVGVPANLQNYQSSPWYRDLGRSQQLLVDQIANTAGAADLGDVVINYSLGKSPAQPRNMLVGGRYEFSKTWEIRTEVGFIGRRQALVSMAYRFPW